MPPCLAARRTLVCVALVLALAACGRRGPLEPSPGAAAPPPPPATAPAQTGRAVPADPRVRPKPGVRPQASAAPAGTNLATQSGSVVADTPDDEEEAEDDLTVAATPSPTPRKRKGRPYVVPTESFVLDPLL